MPNPFHAMVALAVAAIGGVAGLAWLAGTERGTAPHPERLAAVDGPVLVELFTSQGCSSCPPADALLAKLAKEPGIVAISRPVTYWDRLGWKDTLARNENTALQRAYAAKGVQGAGIYTPQAVVQGGAAVVGSREADLRGLAAAAPSPARIVIAAGRARIDGTTDAPASVTLIALRSSVDVAIGRGENGGRRMRYTNVVIDERPIGKWQGGAASFAIPDSALGTAGADRHALVVQQTMAGKVLGARYFEPTPRP